MEKKARAQWGSKLGFILAAAGSAVGLGNIWKFPGKAFAGGGGAYLVIYLLIVILIGLPVMLTEISLGRHTQKNTLGTFRMLNRKFSWVGWFGVITGAVILCYYFHVGGWVLSYVFTYITESGNVMADGLSYFYRFLGYDPAVEATFFPLRAIIFAALFVLANTIIIIRGVEKGIEKFNKWAMPALFVILIILLIRAITLPGAKEGLSYMMSFDWSKVNSGTFISALGQAFFSLSLGMAIMITYGSYLSKKEDIAKSSLIICGLDTLVAFLAGFIIVPAVFATLGAEGVGKGGGFAFASLAGVFQAMPLSALWGVLFYILLLFAAVSSAISIEEGTVAFIVEEFNTDRKKTTIMVSLVCFAIGVLYTLSQASYNITLPWIDFTGISKPILGDWLEFWTDRILLPVAALGECIFVGWIWRPEKIREEVTLNGSGFGWFKLYSFLIKFICPAAIATILVYSLATGTTVS